MVTDDGIETENKPQQLAKAFPPIEVTVLGITVFLHPNIRVLVPVSIIALQLSLESYAKFPSSTETAVIPEQFTKAYSPIDVTEAGIVTEANLPLL